VTKKAPQNKPLRKWWWTHGSLL